MAEIVGTAVATEAVSRISSILSGDKASHESAEGRAERLEMAVLKIRSVVAVSEDLHISHPPLLQWKAKLKRASPRKATTCSTRSTRSGRWGAIASAMIQQQQQVPRSPGT